MTKWTRCLLIAGFAAGAITLVVGSAGASQKPNSFDGSCSVQGTVGFSPPVTNTTQSLAVVYDATGSCSGTLNGNRVSSTPVTLHHSGNSEGSCFGAQTTGPGHGAITFADGAEIPYTFTFQAIGTEILFKLYGQRSGAADGHGSFLTTRTPSDTALKCAGQGVSQLPMDMTIDTSSPLVSKRANR
jgi:hypothetical protein